MFIKSPLILTPLKRIIYLIATTILGLEVNFLILAGIQTIILRWLLNSEKNIIRYSGYPPQLIVLAGFLILGAIWGYALGRHWWQIVYIEKRYNKNQNS